MLSNRRESTAAFLLRLVHWGRLSVAADREERDLEPRAQLGALLGREHFSGELDEAWSNQLG